MNILVIEDSRFLRAAIEKGLTRAGYAVTAVADGAAGVRVATASRPSLILLDMMLPGLDGTSVLRALKQEPSTAKIPVVVLTGLSQRNEGKLKKAGAAVYIEKSALELEKNADALIRVVENTLKAFTEDHGATVEPDTRMKADQKADKAGPVWETLAK
jgi:two-component system chemotaxis response regulator CheY